MRIVASSQDTTILLMQNWPSPPQRVAALDNYHQAPQLSASTVLFARHSGVGDCACTTLTSSPISASVSV
jgi:hypothetical protein